MLMMPSLLQNGQLLPFSETELAMAERLQRDVGVLASEIGERNTRCPEGLQRAAAFIAERFERLGYNLREEQYLAEGLQVANIEAEVVGTRLCDEIVIVGAHYDSAPGTPGSNDNASGAAAILELARMFRDVQPTRTVRFVAFVNEEPPFFQTPWMGSRVYAEGAKNRSEKIVAMLCLECLGYYSDVAGSQLYPPPFDRFCPDTADFIAFVSNIESHPLLRRCLGYFRKTTAFATQCLVAPERVPIIGWSDQSSF